MSVTISASDRRGGSEDPTRGGTSLPPPMVLSEPAAKLGAGAGCSCIDLGDRIRLALIVIPRGAGTVHEQIQEVLSAMTAILRQQVQPMVVTAQTVFLKDGRDQAACRQALAGFYGANPPVTSVVLQAPCGGAAVAIEAWAIGGKGVRVEHFGRQALAVSYGSVRWVYCAGVNAGTAERGAYRQTLDGLARLHAALAEAGSSFPRVVRTWFYLGGIMEAEAGVCRYQELNRARTEFYQAIHFQPASPAPNGTRGFYPASTGIGMAGGGLVASCVALETGRDDLLLVPLENPQQTPAYAYDRNHSPQSPKFSRAVALVLGDYVTTWVSGTASIVRSESCYPGDPEQQTAQTIDNIERLISAENFAAHGLKGSGASLRDLAKIRVYLKRAEDMAACRAICKKRFGPVPAIYAVADICRPELLVEIEGVAFARYSRLEAAPPLGGPTAAD